MRTAAQMHRVCSSMATPYEKPALVLMELMGGGVVIERDPECNQRAWRMSEELECQGGNSTLLLAAVWVQLCMHVCIFFPPPNNALACFPQLHPCTLNRPQSSCLNLSLRVCSGICGVFFRQPLRSSAARLAPALWRSL